MKNKYVRDENSAEVLEIVLDSMTVDLSLVFSTDMGLTTILRNQTVNCDDNIVSAFAANKTKLERYLESVVNEMNEAE